MDIADSLEIASERRWKKLKHSAAWNRQHRRYNEPVSELVNNNDTKVHDSNCSVFSLVYTNDDSPAVVVKSTSATDHDTDNEHDLIQNDENIQTPLELNDFSEDDECSTSSQLNYLKHRLHPYTDVSFEIFSHKFLHLLRKSNVNKTHAQEYLTLIKNILPEPNVLPNKMAQLHRKLGINENLFTKRIVCLTCLLNIVLPNVACPQCGIRDESRQAFIYDVDIPLLISSIIKRSSAIIEEYKISIRTMNDNMHYTDIPFSYVYQKMLKRFNHENIISLMFHLDGMLLSIFFL